MASNFADRISSLTSAELCSACRVVNLSLFASAFLRSFAAGEVARL